ncbi:MAG: GTPase Era [Clostridia bacterium]|nr:GTPase Era [Clostridia bacterium]
MYKCGFIGIIGKTNAGKSTLINSLVGQKVAIVTPKKQTTRDNILGILTDEKHQLIFVDTPGIHKTKNQLDKLMMYNVRSAVASVDIIFYVIDGKKNLENQEIENIIKFASETPTIVGISKQDINKQENVAKIIEILAEIKNLKAVIPFSSIKNLNIELIKNEILKLLPENEEKNFYYEEDVYTDKSVRFMTSEIIREQTFLSLNDELPYGVAVIIKRFEEKSKLIVIDAELVCEKLSHKNIIIGKGGLKIKEISTNARKELEKMLNNKVMLTIWVKVNKNWRQLESLTLIN